MNIAAITPYLRLMRWHQPIGFLLLLWPTLWALWIAGGGQPEPKIVFIFILGVFLMRSAGCVINDIADRHYDGYVQRTKARPLACGQLSVEKALLLFSVLILLAGILLLFLNPLTRILACVGLWLAILYPWMKRYTYWPQAVLAAAFSWGIPMAFAAECNSIPPVAWFLYLLTLLWPLIYDTIYAMVDLPDDRKIGIKSTALLFGPFAQMILIVLKIFLVLGWLLLGYWLKLKVWYFIGVLSAAILFAYQQYLLITGQAFKAFIHNHWVGLVIWLGLAAHYWIHS